MSPRRAAGARIALAIAGLVVTAALAACGADVEPQATTPAGGTPTATATTPAVAEQPAKPHLRPPLAFHLRHLAQLRRTAGGKVVAAISTRTEFKSPRILAVVRRKPGWVQVRTAIRKHPLGWLALRSGALFSQPRSIVIDLSKRRLTLYHRGKATNTYKVAVGAPGTPTPRGTFAVTDRLRVVPGTPYGCCVLALTAHQPHIAQGWGGGDRVAIHATPATWSIGKAVSHGCLRSSDRALRDLFRRVRLGTKVVIHA